MVGWGLTAATLSFSLTARAEEGWTDQLIAMFRLKAAAEPAELDDATRAFLRYDYFILACQCFVYVLRVGIWTTAHGSDSPPEQVRLAGSIGARMAGY